MARIAIDIDSTLHHYWPLLADLARSRYGVELPYAEQRDWGITVLERDQVRELIAETHSEPHILAAEPYPGAVETVRRWHESGHWIHITSHRTDAARGATAEWLGRIGLPYDDLHCSFDKVTRCGELGIDVLIDDSPVNLMNARERGIAGATIVHPWNERLVERGAVIGARGWPELARALRPLLDAEGVRRSTVG